MTGRASAEVIDLGVAASRPGKRSTMRWPYPADLDRVRNFYGHLNDTATNYRFFGIRLHLADSELGAVVGPAPSTSRCSPRSMKQLIGIGE